MNNEIIIDILAKSLKRFGDKEGRPYVAQNKSNNVKEQHMMTDRNRHCHDATVPEREGEREEGGLSGLDELTMNPGRFIFSGAFCLLKEGKSYMSLPRLL